ncbi:MAG TPA: hypothetical protein VGV36_06685 [Solirubrobacteraceae bacterium]|nr:hypothetical protein [Solirubrobacteraceae bacterium]
MKLRTVLPTALAAGAAALGLGAVGALAQEDRERPAPREERGEHGRMMGGADMHRLMRSMDRHHREMVGEMRDIAPEMARTMDRHHRKMMGQMHENGMGGMGRG